jgi:hypothetical protein
MFSLPLLALFVGTVEPTWHDSFAEARAIALKSKRDLVIYFRPDNRLDNALKHPSLKPLLAQHVCVKVRPDHEYQGKRYLDHPALTEMMGRPGLAVISFHNEKLRNFRTVISAHPFVASRYHWAPQYGAKQLGIILGLPRTASLSQRSMIYALRVHPDRPQSVYSGMNSSLSDHAETHSARQAAAQHQHHADILAVSRRLEREAGTDSAGASEVVAESWGKFVGGENVLEAAFSCVDAWRQSPGHWGAISRRHRYFAFDIAQGGNGTWYATGIFGD